MRITTANLGHAVSLCAATLAVALLAGCTDVAAPHPLVSPSRAVATPSGSASVGCSQSRPVEPDTPEPGTADLIIGPLVFPGLADGYNFAGPPDADPDGVTFFKIGAELASDSTVTMTVSGSARGYAGIVTEQGSTVGYSQVTYTSCPSTVQPGRVWWVGGFSLSGRRSACVPFDVQVGGEPALRHLVLPIESRSCRA